MLPDARSSKEEQLLSATAAERRKGTHKLWSAPIGDDKLAETGGVLAVEAQRVLLLE